ncbi:NAD(P)-binding protein [Rhizodiscina lignyota]|uniref:NAD(P)-binding protein n=1 Tax=Rhizodiscina lignyota TaxID=1504668 RepID=A0A9P4IMQ0_9PEZI|nr:NAD(P)-binding protein [Rhizodiscina lignyota]
MADTLKLQDEQLRARLAPVHTGHYFTGHTYKSPPEKINPKNVRLSKPYVVCITGAGRGLGAATAVAYAQAGASGIVISSRTSSELDEVKKQILNEAPNCQVTAQTCDVVSDASVMELVNAVEKEHGRLDVLVNNAGYLDRTGFVPLTEGEPEEFRRTMDVNVFGAYLVTRAFLPLLLNTESGAKVVIGLSSMSSHVARYSIAMGLSKLALNRFIEFLAVEYKNQGLMAYALHPGSVPTKMSSHAPVNWGKFIADSPDLCGAMVVWLTKEKRPWLSGRYVAALWDTDELEAQKDEIVEQDKLKFRMVV